MQRDRVVFIQSGGVGELTRDFRLRRAENNARAALPLGLRLTRHRVFQRLRNLHIADLDRLHRDTPRIGLLIEQPLQLAPHHLALGDHLRQLMPPDRLSQRRLRAHEYRVLIILHLEHALLGVPHDPKNDGIHVGRDRVLGQRGLGRDARDSHALVHHAADRVDDRNDVERARAV